MAKARKQVVHLDKDDALVSYTESAPVDEEIAAEEATKNADIEILMDESVALEDAEIEAAIARREAQRQGRIAEVLAMGGSSKNQMQERLKTPSLESLEAELTEANIESAIAAIEDSNEREIARRVAEITGKLKKTRAPRSSPAPRAPKVLTPEQMEAKALREQKAEAKASLESERLAKESMTAHLSDEEAAFIAESLTHDPMAVFTPVASGKGKRVSKSTRVASEGDIHTKTGVVMKPHNEWAEPRRFSAQDAIEVVSLKMQGWKNGKIAEHMGCSSTYIYRILRGEQWVKETGITPENPIGPAYQPKWLVGEVVRSEADTVEGSDDIEGFDNTQLPEVADVIE